MKTFTLKNDQYTLNCSALGLGTAKFGVTEAISDEQCYALLDRYVQLGGNVLDTASVYGRGGPGNLPRGEVLLGRWLADRGCRKDMIVVTKGGHYALGDPNRTIRLSRAELDADMEQSLDCLGTEIDLYFLHRDDPNRPVEEIIDTLNEYIRRGYTRFIGASNWTMDRIKAANEYAKQSGQQGFIASEIGYSLRPADNGYYGDPTIPPVTAADYAAYAGSGITVFSYNSQASGFFSRHLHTPDADLRCSAIDADRLRRVRRVCAQTGLTPEQVVLGYLTSQPFDNVALFSVSTIERMNLAMAAADITLTTEQLRMLDGGDK